MSPAVKFLVGLLAVLVLGWIHHGPLGNGERHVSMLEQQAKAIVSAAGIPGVTVSMDRNPLSRAATLAGPADRFQREGQGGQKGLTEQVADVPGIAAVRWSDEGESGRATPLLAETLGLLVAAYLFGTAIGWFVFGRNRPRD